MVLIHLLRGDSQVYKFIEGDWHLIAGPFYGIQGNGPQVSSVAIYQVMEPELYMVCIRTLR